MKTVKTILLILMSTAVLSACGLRGPLYLQDEAPATTPAVEQDSTPDKDDAEDKDKDKEKEKEFGPG